MLQIQRIGHPERQGSFGRAQNENLSDYSSTHTHTHPTRLRNTFTARLQWVYRLIHMWQKKIYISRFALFFWFSFCLFGEQSPKGICNIPLFFFPFFPACRISRSLIPVLQYVNGVYTQTIHLHSIAFPTKSPQSTKKKEEEK